MTRTFSIVIVGNAWQIVSNPEFEASTVTPDAHDDQFENSLGSGRWGLFKSQGPICLMKFKHQRTIHPQIAWCVISATDKPLKLMMPRNIGDPRRRLKVVQAIEPDLDRARGTVPRPPSAVSSFGGFRTPAAELAALSLKRPASETLHRSGSGTVAGLG
jgi:hypothetical protein